jgi:hypothetical protein
MMPILRSYMTRVRSVIERPAPPGPDCGVSGRARAVTVGSAR